MSVFKNNQTFTDSIEINNGADLNNSTTLNNNSLEFSYMGGDQYIFISNTVGNPAIEIAEYPSSNSNSKLTSTELTFNDNNNPSDSLMINKNSLNFLYDGGYREVFLGNFAGSQELLIADALNNVESKLITTSLTFSDNSTLTKTEYNADFLVYKDASQYEIRDLNGNSTATFYADDTTPSNSYITLTNPASINLDSRAGITQLGDINSEGNSTTIVVDDTNTTITLDVSTIDFKNTSTTTSTANYNADIKTTSNGVSTKSFLNVKLNGTDIWIPYFTTNPSL